MDRPTDDPLSTPAADTPEGIGEATTALWPTAIPRPTRTQVLSLVLITLLSLGPVIALVAIVRTDTSPVATLADEPTTPADGAHLEITATSISATTGELRVRVVLSPAPSLLENGRPTDDLVLSMNDANGKSTAEFPADQPLGPANYTLALHDGSVRQFPFDSYTIPVIAVLSRQSGGTLTPVPITLELRTAVDGFAVTGSIAPIGDPEVVVRQANMDAARSASTLVYVVWMMVLMYGLAISGVFLLWSVVIRRTAVPVWGFAMFVGVLFALPPLRLALPGNPPLGVLVDFVSFYWAVTIVGITLLWLVAVGIRQSRATDERHGVGPGDRPQGQTSKSPRDSA